MKFTNFLIDKIVGFILLLCVSPLISGLLFLLDVPAVFIVIIVFLSMLPTVILFVVEYFRKRKYYTELLRTLDNIDKKTLVSEVSAEASFLDGKILYDILKTCNKYQNDMIAEALKKNREYREFLDIWVHEIKTPIASARLMIENEKNVVTLRIDDELRKIDGFVELVLFYARSTSFEKDFKVSETTVRELVGRALKTYSKPIIQAKGTIIMEELDIAVIADIKQSAFIIGQIISNSVKYRKENLQMKFFAEKQNNSICLSIEDNGIGIPEADLGRIFDKGFTGENGRAFTKSTGIGLYLCKLLCDKMNVKIAVMSNLGNGTTIQLYFPIESKVLKASE